MVNLQQMAPNAPILYVTFSAEINPMTSEGLIAVMTQAATKRVQHVYLALSTPGGQTREGMNLYNILKGLPFQLTIHNVGSVDSIGNAIFAAGKQRYANASSTFLFHGVGFNVNNQTRFEERQFRDGLESLLADQKRIGGAIVNSTSLTDDEIADLFRYQQTKDADWAVEKGIIHEIREFKLPMGVPTVSLVFQR